LFLQEVVTIEYSQGNGKNNKFETSGKQKKGVKIYEPWKKGLK
jgi:hypothetical protein